MKQVFVTSLLLRYTSSLTHLKSKTLPSFSHREKKNWIEDRTAEAAKSCTHMSLSNKMNKLIMLLFFCHVLSAVKYSLKFFFTASSGVSDFQLVGTAEINGIERGYCDGIRKILEPRQDLVKKYFEDKPQEWQFYTVMCFENMPNLFRAQIHSVKQLLNQSGGVHILQIIGGCEWDEETGEVNGFMHYGYDGEDFMSLDLKTSTWIALKPQAVTSKLRWDAEKSITTITKLFLTQMCPEEMRKALDYGRKSILRTDLPSVSLLQKTPSSPVSCHATGFFPDRAMMFWRKDGEEIHEDVDHGEILPNNDGSFQIRVDLNLSSVTPEDWRRYDCVFQLSGEKDDIITKLDKAKIRTNWGKTLLRNDKDQSRITIIAVVVVLAVGLIAVIGFIVYRKKKAPVDSSERSERLSTQMWVNS